MTEKQGTLRADMPQTAKLIDDLRAAFGREYVDALLLRAKQGHGGFYAAEISPQDGRLVEFGSTARFGRGPDGRRASVEEGVVVLPEEAKRNAA